jgi:hypothetical protein
MSGWIRRSLPWPTSPRGHQMPAKTIRVMAVSAPRSAAATFRLTTVPSGSVAARSNAAHIPPQTWLRRREAHLDPFLVDVISVLHELDRQTPTTANEAGERFCNAAYRRVR